MSKKKTKDEGDLSAFINFTFLVGVDLEVAVMTFHCRDVKKGFLELHVFKALLKSEFPKTVMLNRKLLPGMYEAEGGAVFTFSEDGTALTFFGEVERRHLLEMPAGVGLQKTAWEEIEKNRDTITFDWAKEHGQKPH